MTTVAFSIPARDIIADVVIRNANSFAPVLSARIELGFERVGVNVEQDIAMLEGAAQAAYLGENGLDTFQRRGIAAQTIRNGMTRLQDVTDILQRDRIVKAMREAALGLV